MKTILSITTRSLVGLALLCCLAVAAPTEAAETAAGVVNINSATAEELALLPGIGPSVAARIVAHRAENGAFRKAEELMLVRGVGEKTFERLRQWVAIEGKTTLAEKVRVPRTKPETAQD